MVLPPAPRPGEARRESRRLLPSGVDEVVLLDNGAVGVERKQQASERSGNREIKRPFSPTINLSLSWRVVNRNQSHECLVKIAVLRGVFGPCIGPGWPIPPLSE